MRRGRAQGLEQHEKTHDMRFWRHRFRRSSYSPALGRSRPPGARAHPPSRAQPRFAGATHGGGDRGRHSRADHAQHAARGLRYDDQPRRGAQRYAARAFPRRTRGIAAQDRHRRQAAGRHASLAHECAQCRCAARREPVSTQQGRGRGCRARPCGRRLRRHELPSLGDLRSGRPFLHLVRRAAQAAGPLARAVSGGALRTDLRRWRGTGLRRRAPQQGHLRPALRPLRPARLHDAAIGAIRREDTGAQEDRHWAVQWPFAPAGGRHGAATRPTFHARQLRFPASRRGLQRPLSRRVRLRARVLLERGTLLPRLDQSAGVFPRRAPGGPSPLLSGWRRRDEETVDIYQVGGSVRDELLGLPVKDRDWVVVGATPEEMETQGFRRVGKDFPVFLHPATHEEYALARTERKTAPGYKGFVVHAAPDVTLEDDLRRRDLPINAIARAGAGRLPAPHHGAVDLAARRLRHVSPAFAEDPVRILRVARFAARFAPLGFEIADETLDLMRAMVQAGEVDALVPERVWAELIRALGEQRPAHIFEVLRACCALQRLLPELDQLFGVTQKRQQHTEIDTGIHVMQVLNRAAELSADTRVRFAALLHDLGKGTTPAADWPRHVAHEARGLTLIDALCRRLRVPNDHRELALLVAKYHGVCHRIAELRPATVLDTLQALDALRRPERFELFLLACEADATGRPGFAARGYPQAAVWRALRGTAAATDAGALATAGLGGEALIAAIRRERINAIRKMRIQEGLREDDTLG